jgi:hypothetical protein
MKQRNTHGNWHWHSRVFAPGGQVGIGNALLAYRWRAVSWYVFVGQSKQYQEALVFENLPSTQDRQHDGVVCFGISLADASPALLLIYSSMTYSKAQQCSLEGHYRARCSCPHTRCLRTLSEKTDEQVVEPTTVLSTITSVVQTSALYRTMMLIHEF